jgi:hypothetical protein
MQRSFRRSAVGLWVLVSLSVGCTEPPQPEARESDPAMRGAPIEMTVELKREYEIDEWIFCTIKITNTSEQTVTIPNIFADAGKHSYEGARHFIGQGVLQVVLQRQGDAAAMPPTWPKTPGQALPDPWRQLRPGQSASHPVPLSWPYAPSLFAIDRQGDYRLAVTLDTNATEDDRAWKGSVSATAAFSVVPARIFRAKAANETVEDYARAKIDFCLARIERGQGRFFANVAEILNTPQGVPALIELLDSEPRARASAATMILENIAARSDSPEGRKPDARTKQQWKRWWETTGSAMSMRDLWHNFDSHWQ